VPEDENKDATPGQTNARQIGPGASDAGTSAAEQWKLRWACRRLEKLGSELRRQRWAAEARYRQSPPTLYVSAEQFSPVGDSIVVVRGPGAWWYRSSTGALLGTCSEPLYAAEAAKKLLSTWGIYPRGQSDSLT
jgi:hypothetical protein